MITTNKHSNPLRSLICFMLALLLVMPLAACKKEETAKEYDPEAIAASIGDETLTYALYSAAFDSYAEYLQQLGYDPYASVKDLEGLQDIVFNALVSDMVALYHAKKDGFTLDESAKESVNKQAQEELSQIKEEYMKLAEEALQNFPGSTVEEQVGILIGELSKYYTGKTMTFEEYSEEYTRELMNSKLIEEYKASICAEFAVSEAQITEWYSKQSEKDEEAYAEKPELFKEEMEYFEQYSGIREDAYPPTYVPEGYSRIMDIVVYPDGSLSDEYYEKLRQLNLIGEECSTLLLNDALNGSDANAERIAELLEQYRTLEAETNEMYDEYTRSAREKIDAAYKALEDGEDFAAVMLRYTENTVVAGDGEDPGCEAFRTKGQIISLTHKSTNDWTDTVKEIYSMTEKGCYSTVFADVDGSLHIIYRGEDIEPGAVQLEDIHDIAESIVRSEHADSDWTELLDAWTDDTDLFIDKEILRVVGRDKLKSNSGETTDK